MHVIILILLLLKFTLERNNKPEYIKHYSFYSDVIIEYSKPNALTQEVGGRKIIIPFYFTLILTTIFLILCRLFTPKTSQAQK